MTLICRGCSRVNPPGALFCYHDGLALGNGDRPAGPLAVGAQPFLSPFVFPSGRVCRNFDELAIAADELWEEAQDLLREGSLAGFLGSIGRADLGRIARQAAAAADLNRALDDFLGRLPTSGMEPARLYAHPLAVNLGLVRKGDSHHFQLHLVNQGRGLLHGHLSTEETPWLVLGEPPGVPRRLFECHQDLTIPVHIHLDRLRAAARPQEGRILIESSGGSLAVVVRADRPVQPFEGGLLAGVLTPRQVAERARNNPKLAAFSFESGAVAAWYDANGWTYPIQGPQATGLGAVQQFFEALGLTTPPRVELSETSVKFQGDPGTALEHTLKLKAAENRPVYAHATSTAPWLRVGRISLEGRTARIRLQVPSVPEMPGETLQGKLLVSANGNQRFTVAVSLSVKGGGRPAGAPVVIDWAAVAPPRRDDASGASFGAAAVARPPGDSSAVPEPDDGPVVLEWNEAPPARRDPPPPVGEDRRDKPGGSLAPGAPLPQAVPVARAAPEPPSWAAAPPPVRRDPVPREEEPIVGEALPDEPVRAAPVPEDRRDKPGGSPAPSSPRVMPVPLPPLPRPEPRVEGFDLETFGLVQPRSRWPHLVPLLLVLAVLAAIVSHDLLLPDRDDRRPQVQPPPEALLDLKPYVRLQPHDRPSDDDVGAALRRPTLRFGLHTVPPDNKDPEDEKEKMRLTFDPWGRSNNTCLRVDGVDSLFGSSVGNWVEQFRPLGQDAETDRTIDGFESVWRNGDIEVRQHVKVVPGRQSRRLDTCLIQYTIENKGDRPHTVGLRFLLDTFIGDNDGVPFTIPGRPGLCDTMAHFDRPDEVPDFIEALQRDDLRDPGTVARIQFRLGRKLEAPNRVQLGAWPHHLLKEFGYQKARGAMTLWDVPRLSMRVLPERVNELPRRGRARVDNRDEIKPDSAVVVYWDEKWLEAGGKREVGFTYGLGNVVSDPEGRMLLTLGGRFVPGGEVTLTALVKNPARDERLTLSLPEGLQLLPDSPATQDVPAVARGAARPTSPVTWRLVAKSAGTHRVQVRSSSGLSQSQDVIVYPPPREGAPGVFD